MKGSTEELLYKKLISDHGFYMKQYESSHHNSQKYIALKNVEGGIYAVLITDEINENIDVYEARNFLSSISERFSILVLKNDSVICVDFMSFSNKNSLFILRSP